MMPMQLQPRQADFIMFWRDIFQGRLPSGRRNEILPKAGLTLHAETVRLLQRDLATICVGFLLSQGGAFPRLRRAGDVHVMLEDSATYGDQSSPGGIAFQFSRSWGEYLVCVYEGREFQASDHSFQAADALALLVLLDRLFQPDGTPSLLGRSGLFTSSSLAGLIAAMPLATICYYDRLPDDAPPFSLGAAGEADVLCAILEALAPFIGQRWQMVDRNGWLPGSDPKKLARLLRKREQIATTVFDMCRETRRIEILSIFARLAESIFSADFFDVDRSLPRIVDRLEQSVDKTLDLPGPHFSQVYRLRAPCPSEYLTVETILDQLGHQDSFLQEWHVNDLLGLLFDIPGNRVDRDLDRLLQEVLNSGARERALVKTYLKAQAEPWFTVFFTAVLKGLQQQLTVKIDRLGGAERRNLHALVTGVIKPGFLDRYSLPDAVSNWMLRQRVRNRLEDRYLAKEHRLPMPAAWSRRRKKERLLEQKLINLLDNPRDNICTWAEALRLDREQERQEVIEDVLAGFSFVGQLKELEKWAYTLDTYDEQEGTLRTVTMTVLATMAEPAQRKKLFERYDRLAPAIGYVL